MIESAKISTLGEDFAVCKAVDISVNPRYDIVMSDSVFQYFESLDYAEKVLRKMIQKSIKLTYIGEISNKEYEQELMDYRRSTIEDFETRYSGLDRLFLSKDWVENIAKDFGKKVMFTDVNNPYYVNSKYSFNCYIY